jgi:hypothetical protein
MLAITDDAKELLKEVLEQRGKPCGVPESHPYLER